MMNTGDTLADVPELGGKLTQWHVHDNLCFAGPRVAGLTDAEGNCAAGLTKGDETPMIHVWIESHPCGPVRGARRASRAARSPRARPASAITRTAPRQRAASTTAPDGPFSVTVARTAR